MLRSPFEAEAIRQLTMSVDYYRVVIDGAISPASTEFVYQQCLNAFGGNPTYDPNNEYCKRILRLPTNGFWLATNAMYQNLGYIATRGVDAQIDWSMKTPFPGGMTGTLFANVNANYLDSYEVQNVKGGATLEHAGTGTYFRWRLYTTLGFSAGPATVSLAWRHLPETRNEAYVANPNTTVLPTEAYDVFDLAGRWTITPSLTARFGVENLFDKDPPRVGVNPGVTTAAGLTEASAYDVVGRRFYVGLNARF